MPANSTQPTATKPAGVAAKGGAKSTGKDMPISPGAPAPPAPIVGGELLGSLGSRAELLGSLTTQQQQRTSARVIKKLRLDDAAADKEKKVSETQESDTPKLKEDPAELAKLQPSAKPRMPKAIWLTEEKNLFFEALNEYGKDFDAITAHICMKMKRKGVPDAMLKTKNQVSHFYYRTWHKLSKHVHFDENVKKVAQELYALINYGELRKKLSSVNERTCARLGELVSSGSLAVRARGRSLRVRTPVCRALRSLNHLAERALCGRVCHRALVVLRARDASAWARVQACAHNPRAAAALPLRAPLAQLLAALEARWRPAEPSKQKCDKRNGTEKTEEHQELEENGTEAVKEDGKEEDRIDLESHLNLETERMILQERKLPRRLALHVGPKPKAAVHLPTLAAGEHLSSQKICFASYLERMGRDRDPGPSKIRTPKRQRKDSATEKDKEVEQKKMRGEEAEPRLMDIDERAIDGIELMASIKQKDEEKPSENECDKYIKIEIEEHELQERDAQYKEAASEKGKEESEKEKEASEKEKEASEKEKDASEKEKEASEKEKEVSEKEKEASEKEKDSFSEMEDEDKFNNCDTDNESDGRVDKARKETKFKNLKVKFRLRPKKRGGSIYTLVTDTQKDSADESPKLPEEPQKVLDGPQNVLEEPQKAPEEQKSEPDIDVEFVMKQIRKGWSVYDAGQLTIGDLYLMFGSRSRIELDYWWAEPTPPLPQPCHKHQSKTSEGPSGDKITLEKKEKVDKIVPDKKIDKTVVEKKDKMDKTPEKGTDSSVEDDGGRRESDTDLFSPKNTFSQDSNDGLSGDERRNEQQASSEAKCGLSVAAKLVNRPAPAAPPAARRQLALMTEKLKRLLALAGNPHALAGGGGGPTGKCGCALLCAHHKRRHEKQQVAPPPVTEVQAQVFRHPTPIAPKPDTEIQQQLNTSDLPRYRRGRPRAADRRVVVQRLLPLLPKLPPADNLIPVKLVSNLPPQLPRLLPKPPQSLPQSTDNTQVYVLSESHGQFYFHDGERKIPIVASVSPAASAASSPRAEDKDNLVKTELKLEVSMEGAAGAEPPKPAQKPESSDIANFLPSMSMSLSPSRLLRDADGAWLEGSVQDFSLSSFLGHLESRAQPDLAVDLGVQSLMAESSVDYVAKFADLAAEVTDEHE